VDALTPDELCREKQRIRKEAVRRRNGLPGAEALSRRIFQRLAALPEYARARTVMLYLDIRSEVRTRWYLPTLWGEHGKGAVVPYCRAEELGLFRVTSLEELAPGTMRILEPRPQWRDRAERCVAPDELDLILVPGVAFDRRGGRLGYGRGYYDKLLRRVRPDAAKIALCFECQLFAEIPSLAHDVRMDKVVTEDAVYP
jgi:5-formyltetrahydrofolate cyclo-ligase